MPRAVVLSFLVGCGGAQLSGSVTDVAGGPLQASITVVGTACQGDTDPAGAFGFGCRAQPCVTMKGELDGGDGKCTVIVAATGYISKEERVDLTQSGCCDLGKQVLVKIPETDGLFQFSSGSYESMTPGFLRRNLEGRPPKKKSWCLDRANDVPNRMPAGKRPFFDKRHEGWRAWKLDAEGCAYRMSQEPGAKWQVDYAERPDQTEQQLEPEMNVVFLTFEKGEYFIADWKSGFFVEAPDVEGDKDDRKRYSGYHIVVE